MDLNSLNVLLCLYVVCKTVPFFGFQVDMGLKDPFFSQTEFLLSNMKLSAL